MTKKQLLEAIRDAPDDAVIVVIEHEPSLDFDNEGVEIERVTWDHYENGDPKNFGVIYVAIKGLDPESRGADALHIVEYVMRSYEYVRGFNYNDLERFFREVKEVLDD